MDSPSVNPVDDSLDRLRLGDDCEDSEEAPEADDALLKSADQSWTAGDLASAASASRRSRGSGGSLVGRLKKKRQRWLGKAKESRTDSPPSSAGLVNPSVQSVSGESVLIDLGREVSKEELASAMENVVATLGGKAW